jgi:amino acid adenylation domain-containing protein
MFLEEIIKIFSTCKGRNAFCVNDVFYTYGDLEGRVIAIQQSMLANGGSQSGKIGILTSETVDDYASILACWLLGYAYVPVNPLMPVERIGKIIDDAHIDCVLTAMEDGEQFFRQLDLGANVQTIFIKHAAITGNSSIQYVQRSSDSIAYILFTSGSTGVPKGVPITYSNIEAFLDSYNALGIPTDENDGYLQMFELTFDVSVASYLVPILAGACVYSVSARGIKYLNVIKVLKKHNITIATIVPSIVKYLKPYFSEISLPGIKCCILTAEAINEHLVYEWQKCLPSAAIYNLYGPTEATIWCTGYLLPSTIEQSKSHNDIVAIGRPFKNVSTLIVDAELSEVAVKEKGELLLCSNQLTSGYINNAERNSEAFVEIEGKRYYKTGDICYIDEEGDIFYCGRKDDQVKVQGFRIELGEVDMLVKKHLPSLLTVVVKYEDQNKITQIGLVIEGNKDDHTNLGNQLREFLPYYMVPQKLVFVNELPQNSSNKIDKVKLTALF